MEETLEYWQNKLVEFQEALLAETEEAHVDMLKLLKKEIEECEKKIQELQ
jgi:hypothetical protein